jgi:hypothetical protein
MTTKYGYEETVCSRVARAADISDRFGQLGLGQDVRSVDDFTQLHLPTDGHVVGLTVSRWATFITVDTGDSS